MLFWCRVLVTYMVLGWRLNIETFLWFMVAKQECAIKDIENISYIESGAQINQFIHDVQAANGGLELISLEYSASLNRK